MRPTLLFFLAFVAATATACKRSEEPPTKRAPRLTVEGSAFVLEMPDGRVMRGVELAGSTVHFAMGGENVAPVRLASITPDPDRPDLLRYAFQKMDGKGGWEPACAPNAHGERWGFPIALPEGHPGREHAITLTCASGAVGKCVRWGYAPWDQGPRGEDLTPLHAACVRMVRADYCGDGLAHTKNGTSIDYHDALGIGTREAAGDPAYVFEAGWTAQGAVCVNHPRWSELITKERLEAQCPRLASVPTCDEATARSLGARLFNHSLVQ